MIPFHPHVLIVRASFMCSYWCHTISHRFRLHVAGTSRKLMEKMVSGFILNNWNAPLICKFFFLMSKVLNQDDTPFLYSAIFGEGVVNDATSIVLFNSVQSLNISNIDGLIALKLLGTFLYLFFSSTALGIAVSYHLFFNPFWLQNEQLKLCRLFWSLVVFWFCNCGSCIWLRPSLFWSFNNLFLRSWFSFGCVYINASRDLNWTFPFSHVHAAVVMNTTGCHTK